MLSIYYCDWYVDTLGPRHTGQLAPCMGLQHLVSGGGHRCTIKPCYQQPVTFYKRLRAAVDG